MLVAKNSQSNNKKENSTSNTEDKWKRIIMKKKADHI